MLTWQSLGEFHGPRLPLPIEQTGHRSSILYFLPSAGMTLTTIIRVQGVDITLNVAIVNEEIEVQELLNHEFKTILWEMDLKCLMDTLIETIHQDQVYYTTPNGINSTDQSYDVKSLLHLVTRRIRLPGNHTDMTFFWALVVVCSIYGIQLNVGEQIIWSGRYSTESIRRFLPTVNYHFPMQAGGSCYSRKTTYFLCISLLTLFCSRLFIPPRVIEGGRSGLVALRQLWIQTFRTHSQLHESRRIFS